MEISTTNYENTHGRKPRGEGCWAFQFFKGGKDTIEFVPGPFGCSYSAAKKWAIKRAKQLAADSVSVAT